MTETEDVQVLAKLDMYHDSVVVSHTLGIYGTGVENARIIYELFATSGPEVLQIADEVTLTIKRITSEEVERVIAEERETNESLDKTKYVVSEISNGL